MWPSERHPDIGPRHVERVSGREGRQSGHSWVSRFSSHCYHCSSLNSNPKHPTCPTAGQWSDHPLRYICGARRGAGNRRRDGSGHCFSQQIDHLTCISLALFLSGGFHYRGLISNFSLVTCKAGTVGTHPLQTSRCRSSRPSSIGSKILLILYYEAYELKGFSISAYMSADARTLRAKYLPAAPSVGLMSMTFGPRRTTRPSVR